MVSRFLLTLILSIALVNSSCGPLSDGASGLSQNQFESSKYYFSSVKKVAVEVIYEQGADPYIGMTQTPYNRIPYWQILEENLRALYQGRTLQPQFVVPKDLTQMRQITKQNKTEWTDQEIYDLSETVRLNHSSSEQAHFLVLFLNGYYKSSAGVQPKTLGVSIGGTSVIAMFKQVIEASSSAIASSTDKYVEQSTLVHEMGHALGLVNNGLPMVNGHDDLQHTTHCSNPNCVMYWENSGSQALSAFINKINQTGSVVMFDSACLNDARNFMVQ
ncbi:MAG: hypothetical protein KA715_05490 [Xanthomonadaceae bacterium]|nr:hypothetical protein [Xanthomonadaceae bacterium]